MAFKSDTILAIVIYTKDQVSPEYSVGKMVPDNETILDQNIVLDESDYFVKEIAAVDWSPVLKNNVDPCAQFHQIIITKRKEVRSQFLASKNGMYLSIIVHYSSRYFLS